MLNRLLSDHFAPSGRSFDDGVKMATALCDIVGKMFHARALAIAYEQWDDLDGENVYYFQTTPHETVRVNGMKDEGCENIEMLGTIVPVKYRVVHATHLSHIPDGYTLIDAFGIRTEYTTIYDVDFISRAVKYIIETDNEYNCHMDEWAHNFGIFELQEKLQTLEIECIPYHWDALKPLNDNPKSA